MMLQSDKPPVAVALSQIGPPFGQNMGMDIDGKHGTKRLSKSKD